MKSQKIQISFSHELQVTKELLLESLKNVPSDAPLFIELHHDRICGHFLVIKASWYPKAQNSEAK